MKADQCVDVKASIAPVGSRESRTKTEGPEAAISTQSAVLVLALLLRHFSADCRLCRAGIQHPSVRAGPTFLATRDEGVEPAGVNRAYARYLVDLPR
jgi:hypothetical protein